MNGKGEEGGRGLHRAACSAELRAARGSGAQAPTANAGRLRRRRRRSAARAMERRPPAPQLVWRGGRVRAQPQHGLGVLPALHLHLLHDKPCEAHTGGGGGRERTARRQHCLPMAWACRSAQARAQAPALQPFDGAAVLLRQGEKVCNAHVTLPLITLPAVLRPRLPLPPHPPRTPHLTAPWSCARRATARGT